MAPARPWTIHVVAVVQPTDDPRRGRGVDATQFTEIISMAQAIRWSILTRQATGLDHDPLRLELGDAEDIEVGVSDVALGRVVPADDRELTPEWAVDPVRDTLANGTPKIVAGSGSSLFAPLCLSPSFAVSPLSGVRLAMSVQL